MITLTNGDQVHVYVSAGEPRVALYAEDNATFDRESATVWLTPMEARIFAARIIDVADSIDRLDPDPD